MKAMVLKKPGGVENLTMVDLPSPPPPGPGEISVRVGASTINNHDLGIITGRSTVTDGRILLKDGAGVVDAVGSGVTEFATGDMVMGLAFPTWQSGPPVIRDFSTSPGDGIDGFGCEIVTAPSSYFTAVPAGYSLDEAATLPVAAVTSWRALVVNGGLKAGETVLIQGTGGVSIFALQIAKAVGAKVIATSSSDKKLERLSELGADHLINYRTTLAWGQAAFDWTGGVGVDHVVDVGGSANLTNSIRATKIGGHIAIVGVLAGLTGELEIIPILSKQVRLQGCLVGSRQDQTDMVRFFDTHGIKPVIDIAFKLEDLGDAFEHQKSGKHFGKIVISIP